MSEPRLEKTVPAELTGLRLDQALARMFPQYSRSRLKAWILGGAITVDGASLKPRDSVEGGEAIVIAPPEETGTRSEPEPIALDVAYEDEQVIVIDKPAGLVVHPGAGNVSGTLLNGLLHRYPELATLPRAGIVHRLDKDTTGLLMVARSLTAHTALVRQLAERAISRSYDAVCVGVLTAGGTIDAPIGRHPVDRVRMTVLDSGKPAVTHYRVQRRYAAHTWVKVSLETGRTHQIRVHFAWKRHPLVGDPVYGGRLALPAGASPALIAALRAFRRQALCATGLAFDHPETGRRISVSIEPAPDFTRLTEALEQDLAARDL
jgi:23S rRNA pseudouridine1911/1915/1917 synthase